MAFMNFGKRTLLAADINLTAGTDIFRDGMLRGKAWYVDTNSGSDSRSGLSWDHAFLTMQEAFDHLTGGDRIYFVGNVTEHLTSPLATAQNVTIIGAGTRPRHADTHPGGGERTSATWKDAGTATPMLTLRNSGWVFKNILFTGNASSTIITMERNATETAAGEFDASHAQFIGCRFASGGTAISDTGGCFNVVVEDCIFNAMTICILGVGNIGYGQSQWHIRNNHFREFTNGVKIVGDGCVVEGNYFTDGGTPNSTYVLNMNNSTAGQNNFVVNNWFQTATANFNTPDIVGSATDVWFNTSIDSFTAGLESGHEVGNPA